jgi:type II secretory pathway component GspD/PulD (secretin)
MKQRIAYFLSAALLLVAVGASGQELTLDSRGSFAFRQATAAKVFTFAAQSLKLEAVVDQSLKGNVSIELNGVSLRTLLNTACESLGCRWRVDGGKLIVDRDEALQAPSSREADEAGERFVNAVNVLIPSIRLANEPLRSAVSIVAKEAGTGCRVSIPKDYPDSPVTLNLANIRLLDALRQTIAASGGNVRLAVMGSLAAGTETPTNCVIVALKTPRGE